MRRYLIIILLCLAGAIPALAQKDSDFPPRPAPPKLVNDLAGVMSADERELLESKSPRF